MQGTHNSIEKCLPNAIMFSLLQIICLIKKQQARIKYLSLQKAEITSEEGGEGTTGLKRLLFLNSPAFKHCIHIWASSQN